MEYTEFLLDKQDGIAVVTLNRPDKLNALTFDTYRALGDLWAELREDDSVKVVVITGTGKAFCSGGDVTEIIGKLRNSGSDVLINFQRMAGRATHGLLTLRKPAIAAINGTATGAGIVIASACDIRIAVESAKFAFLFPRVGLVSSDLGACWLLPKLVGLTKATELLITGDTFNSADAEKMGFLTKLVPDDKLMEAAMEYAKKLASLAPLATAMTKELIYREASMDFSTAIDVEGWLMALSLHTADHKEAGIAFEEKRRPVFRGK
ncbi:enoyl-CoA hydratase-related protein [Chloroflexota bacterium]